LTAQSLRAPHWLVSTAGKSEFLLYTEMGCAIRPPGQPGLYLAEATMTTSGWVVLAAGEELHVQLLRGASVPADAGPGSDLRWEMARALDVIGGDMTRVTIAVAGGPALDHAGVATEFGRDAARMARQLAALSVISEAGPEMAWDRLSAPVRRAQTLQREEGLLAAVLTYRGRGRVVGRLRRDMLMRFGVSAWR